jgi:uncharacterized protein (TIGR02145 family)
MKQKLFFLMLTLFVLSAASVQAQVTIGADEPPHSAAILDLQSDNLGLKLPTIELGDVSVFQLSGTSVDADGIMVYNSKDETIGGNGKGIYVWEEDKWVFTGKSGQITPVAVPVTRITITSADDATTVRAGSSLQLTAIVEPDAPSNATLNWSIVYDAAATAGSATIDPDGKLTAVKTGAVTARATATDGSGVYGNFAITVRPTDYVASITVRSATGQTTLKSDKTLQLIADVEPSSASQNVIWSIVSGSEYATIAQSGLLSGKSAGGPVVVSAMAADGSGIEDVSFTADVIAGSVLAVVNQQIGDGFYDTYDFNGAVWMVQNSNEGSPSYLYYEPQHYEASYYRLVVKASACPDGWHLPSAAEWSVLMAYVSSPFATDDEVKVWLGTNSLLGRVSSGTGALWHERAEYLDDDKGIARFFANGSTSYEPDVQNAVSNPANVAWPVRCVQN